LSASASTGVRAASSASTVCGGSDLRVPRRSFPRAGACGADRSGRGERHTDRPKSPLADGPGLPTATRHSGSVRDRGRGVDPVGGGRVDRPAALAKVGSGHQPASRGKPRGTRVVSWCRGAPVTCAARERHVTVARNDDRVRNLARFGGIGGAPAALVGHPGERSVARPLAASMRSVSGRRSTARGAGKGRNAADGPGRRAIVPTAPQRGDRARLPLSSVQHVGCGK
jgi:hypothetical protein